MSKFYLEFNGVTCKGCVFAIEQKLSNLENTKLKKIDRTTGNSIIESLNDKNSLYKIIHSFQGCCANCQINLKTFDQLKNDDQEFMIHNDDENQLIKKQYKHALENLIAKKEVACSEYCVCKTTQVNRFEEFEEAPSFSSIYNLTKYLEEFGLLKSGISVIDFGCGTGHDVFQLAPLIAPGKIIGIDVTQEMIDFAKQTSLTLNMKNTFFHQSESLTSISQSSQDLIIANNVYNILNNKNDFIANANKILKIRGLLVIADEFMLDDLPNSLRNDPSYQCGGISGARSIPYIQSVVIEKGFELIRETIVRTYTITHNKNNYTLESGILVFTKI